MFEESFQIASNFCVRKNLSVSKSGEALYNFIAPSMASAPFVFWWDDNTPLHEYNLGNGYVLASTSKDMPPIMEYTISGEPLSQSILKIVAMHGYIETHKIEKIYYWTGIEIVVRLRKKSDDTAWLFHIPDYQMINVPNTFSILRIPISFWTRAQVDAQRYAILSQQSPITTQAIQLGVHPIQYNQNKHGECISGCTPVAWAMLASWWKQVPQSVGRIWSGNTCWSNPWPSYEANPVKCVDWVETDIWKLHDNFLETECNGGTTSNHFNDGADIFKENWGLDWDWEHWDDDKDFEDARHIIDGSQGVPMSQAYIYGGQGHWASYVQAQLLDTAGAFGTGKVGHTIVVHGYDPDFDAKKILACMGWGYNIGQNGSKYIDFYSYSERHIHFVSRL